MVIGAALVGEWAILFVNVLVPGMEIDEVEKDDVGEEQME